MNEQLTLDIQLQDEATLSNYHWNGNEMLRLQLQHYLSKSTPDHIFYLWGKPSSGKSHLLQACCHAFTQGSSMYIPLQQFKHYGPDCLQGLESHQLICIDDIDAIAQDSNWEEALFHFYNKVKDSTQTLLMISGTHSPTSLAIALPDLRSRLAWGLTFQINELSDDDKIQALQAHAKSRGFQLPLAVCQYLITHYSRSLNDLLGGITQLDQASLASKRKITVPFAKKTLTI